MKIITGLRAILLAAILLPSCNKEDQVPAPVIHASLSPASGNTTQTFTFDLSRSESRNGRSTKVFSRWDWDGDGHWDTPFTRMLVYEHRYYAPGTWKPRLEMSNLDGALDTMSFTVPVVRGYSAPKPVLTITPAKGHLFTRFMMDAGATRDDEDSLDQLSFRWDFEGDGQWDTNFGDSIKKIHLFSATGLYTPSVQVRDKSGLISSGKSQVTVTLEDPRLLVRFRCIPDSVTNDTPIIMDASASVDLDFPDQALMYRWDWDNNRTWDTDWLPDAQTLHIFNEEYIHFVRLEIRSTRGLMNDTVQKIRVYHKNKEPRASFALSTFTGNMTTQFRFDCWSTRDAESSPSEMFYRWDFNGDGTWDTGFTHSVITIHQFDSPGTFRALLLVQDPHGGQDTCSAVVYISTGSNKTGIYTDTRGYIYQSYGTVLIGDQWWFTRNMTTQDTAEYYKEPVINDWPTYFYYGDLYNYPAGNLCPPGWRVPTSADWNKLFSNYPEEELFEALTPGGASDFGALFGGMGIGVKATTAVYNGIERYGYYWSVTKPAGADAVSIWTVTFDKPEGKVIRGYNLAEKKMYSVRCMKDAE